MALSAPTGYTGRGGSQSPCPRVTHVGQGGILRCDPVSGHVFVDWYRHNLRQEMEFLISSQYQNPVAKLGVPKKIQQNLIHPEDPAHRAGGPGSISLNLGGIGRERPTQFPLGCNSGASFFLSPQAQEDTCKGPFLVSPPQKEQVDCGVSSCPPGGSRTIDCPFSD